MVQMTCYITAKAVISLCTDRIKARIKKKKKKKFFFKVCFPDISQL